MLYLNLLPQMYFSPQFQALLVVLSIFMPDVSLSFMWTQILHLLKPVCCLKQKIKQEFKNLCHVFYHESIQQLFKVALKQFLFPLECNYLLVSGFL